MEQFLNISVLTDASTVTCLPQLRKKLLLEVFNSVWVAVKVALVLITFSGIVYCSQQYHKHLPIPVKMKMTGPTINQELVQLTKALKHLNCPQPKIIPIAEGVLKGAKTIGVSPTLVLALLYTESQFKLEAVSSKGYKGLMQTPTSSALNFQANKMGFKMGFADVDILLGCRILEEKMRIAKGSNGRTDIRKALAMYKGGLSGEAFSLADEVLRQQQKLDKIKLEVG